MNYIIGGGISGLVFGFYNEDFKIISSDIGGQNRSRFSLGPRILHVNENNERLLNDLGLNKLTKKENIKIARIGYFYAGEVHDDCDEEMREMYYIKSRDLREEDIPDKMPESVMSGGQNIIRYYDITMSQLVKKLFSKIKRERFIIKEIYLINGTKKLIQFNGRTMEKIPYNKIVSTIPATAFFRMYRPKIKCNLKYKNKYFVVVPLEDIGLDFENYDYIYFPEFFIPYHRITKYGNYGIVEYCGDLRKVKIENYWLNAKDKHYMEVGQIYSGEVKNVENIMFLGRYAQWKHSVKIEDIVEASINYREV